MLSQPSSGRRRNLSHLDGSLHAPPKVYASKLCVCNGGKKPACQFVNDGPTLDQGRGENAETGFDGIYGSSFDFISNWLKLIGYIGQPFFIDCYFPGPRVDWKTERIKNDHGRPDKTRITTREAVFFRRTQIRQ